MTETPAASLDYQMLISVCCKNDAVPGGSLAATGRVGAARLRGGASSSPHPYHCFLQVGPSISQSRQSARLSLLGSAHSLTRRRVLPPHTRLRERGWADSIRTRGETLWYARYSIIPFTLYCTLQFSFYLCATGTILILSACQVRCKGKTNILWLLRAFIVPNPVLRILNKDWKPTKAELY